MGGAAGAGGFGGFGGFGGQRAPQPKKGKDVTVTLDVTFEEAFKGTQKRVTVRKVGASETETLDVKVPAGAVDGGRLRFKGKGGQGSAGGPNGDLLVTTRIKPDGTFTRDGADVLVTVPVNVAQAALGASVVVPAPDGTKVRVKVPAGTQPGTVLSLKGKGAPRVKGSGNGDLKVTLDVKVPTTLSGAQRKAMEDFLAATEAGE